MLPVLQEMSGRETKKAATEGGGTAGKATNVLCAFSEATMEESSVAVDGGGPAMEGGGAATKAAGEGMEATMEEIGGTAMEAACVPTGAAGEGIEALRASSEASVEEGSAAEEGGGAATPCSRSGRVSPLGGPPCRGTPHAHGDKTGRRRRRARCGRTVLINPAQVR